MNRNFDQTIQRLIYLIIGLTQQGKSSMIKSILQNIQIKIGECGKGQSITKEPKVYESQDNKAFIDTVGFLDTDELNAQMKEEKLTTSIRNNITNSLAHCLNHEINHFCAIIIAISINELKQFFEEKKLESLLRVISLQFHLNNFDSIIFCLTKGNLYEQDKTNLVSYFKKAMLNQFNIGAHQIIEFKTDYIEPNTQINNKFAFERELFLRKLDDISNQNKSQIQIIQNIEFQIQLSVIYQQQRHAGGRPNILQSQSEIFSKEPWVILKKLNQISSLKILDAVKNKAKTPEVEKEDNIKIDLLKSNLFTTNNILFRKENQFIYQDFFPYKEIKIGKYVSMFTDEFRNEIVEYINDPLKFKVQNSRIMLCLFLQYLLKIDNHDNLTSQYEKFREQPNNKKEAHSYYEQLTLPSTDNHKNQDVQQINQEEAHQDSENVNQYFEQNNNLDIENSHEYQMNQQLNGNIQDQNSSQDDSTTEIDNSSMDNFDSQQQQFNHPSNYYPQEQYE